MNNLQEEYNEEYENQIINEEYKIWKKNSPFLYDMVFTHELDWPSLTVQWLPTKDQHPESDYAIHKLILGTHTSDKDPNYLMIAKVRLPLEDTATDVSEYTVNNKDSGMGLSAGENRLDIETKILHDGEINKARFMPQKYNVIATKTISGEIHVFDYTLHPTKPENDQIKPQLRLTGHTKEGFGLSWNSKKMGYLASGSNDCKICIWNIEDATEINKSMSPILEYSMHKGPVEDVCWHPFTPEIFASCSDDKTVGIWDIREKDSTKASTHVITAHSSDIHSVDINQFQEYLFLTGSGDKTIGLWDMRNTSKKLHSFLGHTDEVIKVEWNPLNQGVFASCSCDRRIIIWDITKIGEEVRAEEAQDGPPELTFIHGGHRAKVPDFSWNTNDTMVLGSVEEENNILQIWQMANNIYCDDDTMELNEIPSSK